MAAVPSIKGSTLNQLVEDLAKLRAEGSLSDAEIEAHLEPEDRALLESGIVSPSGWYPIATHGRMLELCRDVMGGGSNAYIVERGRAQGKRLLAAGLYQQMEYAARAQVLSAEPSARYSAFGRDLKLMVTLSRSILNFTEWSARPDPDHPLRHVIDVTEAADFPELLLYSTEGLIDCIAEEVGHGGMWSWRRIAPDCFRFHMVRDLPPPAR